MMKHFTPFQNFDVNAVRFTLGVDSKGKPQLSMSCEPAGGEVAMVTPAAVTQWPRCTGDGNFGTMWGPTDASKTKFTLDLTDQPINGTEINADYEKFKATLEAIDDKLLDFVTENQSRILGRKNLTREEVKMLQVRTARQKIDKLTGQPTGYTIDLKTPKFAWDGQGGKYERKVTICDYQGNAVANGTVKPGDVVAATMHCNSVYNGMAGDKFGISYGFQDVSVVCQRSNLEDKTHVSAFQNVEWSCGKPYVDQVSEPIHNGACLEQFA